MFVSLIVEKYIETDLQIHIYGTKNPNNTTSFFVRELYKIDKSKNRVKDRQVTSYKIGICGFYLSL